MRVLTKSNLKPSISKRKKIVDYYRKNDNVEKFPYVYNFTDLPKMNENRNLKYILKMKSNIQSHDLNRNVLYKSFNQSSVSM